MDEGQEAVGGFVVSGCDATSVLELVEKALDAIAHRIEQRIDGTLNLAIAFGWYDRIGAVEPGILADGVAVVAAIAKQCLRAILVQVHQLFIGRRVVRFARREDEAEREPVAVGAGVNLAREAAARTAKSLALSPPFAPAA